MKNTIKWILTALLLVGLIVGATLLYNKLGADYIGNNIMTNETQETQMPQETKAEETNTEETEAEESIAETEYEEDYEPIYPIAPDFTVLNEEGEWVKLSDYFGKPIVLNFWATWCYYCKLEMPDFNEAYKLYPDVQFLMVNATDGVEETMASAKKYIAENGFEFDVFYDTKLDAVSTYYISSFPQTFFINANGELVARSAGMLDLETLQKAIGMIK